MSKIAERGEVDHADAVAHLQVLGVGDRVPPAGVPLVGARRAASGNFEQLLVAGVPLRALPAAASKNVAPSASSRA
jgi:hypothetical protein